MTQTITSVDGVRPRYALARAAFLLGITLFVSCNFFYAFNYARFYDVFSPAIYSYVSLVVLTLALLSFGISVFSYFGEWQKIAPATDESNMMRWRVERIVSDAIFQHKKLFVVATVVYGVLFSFIDGVIIYQPNIDFYYSYAVSGPTWRVLTCCGSPGYVPTGLLYLPAQHVGVDLYPLSFLLLVIVSILVGMNISLLVNAFRASSISAKRKQKKGIVGSIVGASVGLFAGCPSCAAAFFLSMIAGAGATAVSTLIATYQPVIVALTVPLLIFSVVWQSKSIGNTLKGCTLKVETK